MVFHILKFVFTAWAWLSTLISCIRNAYIHTLTCTHTHIHTCIHTHTYAWTYMGIYTHKSTCWAFVEVQSTLGKVPRHPHLKHWHHCWLLPLPTPHLIHVFIPCVSVMHLLYARHHRPLSMSSQSTSGGPGTGMWCRYNSVQQGGAKEHTWQIAQQPRGGSGVQESFLGKVMPDLGE